MHHNFNKDFIHHQNSSVATVLKEVIFGVEDGMVSTLGSITGIAIGSGNHQTVILAGVVIIAVESISMGIGSYVSNRSEEDMEQRKIEEEKSEIKMYPKEEKAELYEMYKKDGWPEELARSMSETASSNHSLMLKEMSLRELKIDNGKESISLRGGIFMFFAYIIGGLVPLSSYLFLPVKNAMLMSILVTLVGLFVLGVYTTKFTKQHIIKSGIRMLLLGGLALSVGLIAGSLLKI